MGPVYTEVTDSTITVAHESRGEKRWRTKVKMTATPVSITDGAASGSHGAKLLGTLIEGHIAFHGGVLNVTALAEDSTLTGAAGDAALEMGVGSTAIAAAADKVLAAANDNITDDFEVTMSSGDGTGTTTKGAGGSHDGSATACPVYLNVSGSAATIDADGTVYVTGTLDFVWELISDD